MIQAILQQFYGDLASMPVLRHGLEGAILISIVCSTLSVFVVLKRLAFIGEGIAHSALGGIAVGVALFVSGSMAEQGLSHRLGVDLTTVVFCVLVAWLIGWTSRQKIISEDTSIGIFFVASLALGIVLISLRRAYTADLFSFLFGSVLAVGPGDVTVTAALCAVVLAVTAIFYRQMFLFCLDEELAGVTGLPVGFIHYALLTVLAVTIVISIKILGVLLVAAFLVIPGATARMLTYRYRDMFVLSNLAGLLAVAGGLLLSDIIPDLPSGPAIVLGQFSMFIFAVLWSRLRDRLLPGRQWTAVGTVLVLMCYLGLLAVVGTSAYGAAAKAAAPAEQGSRLPEADWRFFVQALQARDYNSLNDRIDRDPEFVELLTRRIRRLHMDEKGKQLLLDTINAANWQAVPGDLVQRLSAG